MHWPLQASAWSGTLLPMRIRAASVVFVTFYLDRGDAFHADRLLQGSRGFRDGGCRYSHRQAYTRTSAVRGVWMSVDGPAAAVGTAPDMPRTTTFSISTAAARPSWTRALSLWECDSVGMSRVSVPREGLGDDGRDLQVPLIAASNLDIDIPVLEPFRNFQGSLLAFVGIPLLVLAGFAISRSSSIRNAPAPSAEEMERLSTEDILKKLYDDVESKVKEKYGGVEIAPVIGEEEVAAAVAETAAKAGVSEDDVRSAAIAATTVDVNVAASEGQHADMQKSSSALEAERPTHEVIEESTPAPERVEQKAVDLMKEVEKEDVAATPALKRESAQGVEDTVPPVAEPEEHRDKVGERPPLEADAVPETVAAIEEQKEDSEASDQHGRVQEAEVKFRERLAEERERVTRKRRQEQEARTARRDMRTAPSAEDRQAAVDAEEVQDAEWREMRRLQEETEQFFGASAHSRRSPAAAAPEAEFIKSRAASAAPVEAPEVVSEGDGELEQTREELLRGLDAVVADLERKAQRRKEAEAQARQQSQARPPDTEVRRKRAEAETDKEKVVAYVKGLTVARLKAILQDNGQRLPGSKARKADYVEAVVELARLKTSGRFDNTDFM